MINIRPSLSFFPAVKKSALALGLLASAGFAQATTVQIQTVLGDFEINLFDKHTPKTVENFLAYVNAGAYKDTVIHRSVAGFVIQGGGFKFDDNSTAMVPLVQITTNAPVVNEPKFSNVRGTIAMAKLGNNPNSATSQWFINLSDNSANLDYQNSGFTVFGQVTGNGMAIVDAIAALKKINAGGALTELPLRDYTSGKIDDSHLAMIDNIVVLNSSPDTADSLNPKTITPKNNNPGTGGGNGGGGSGGGSAGYLLLLLASLGCLRSRCK
jgi:peptidyl-prolyl cis-trans isomerase A (cyclophilin A)